MNNLLMMREKRNMTQKELSQASGVPQQIISNIETQRSKNPGVFTINKLAKALRCSIYDLIDEREGA